MRILVISNLYPPNVLGGYEVGCARMVEQLRKMGHEIVVLTSRGVPSNFITMEGDAGIRRVLTLWDLYSEEPSGNALRAGALFQGRVIDLNNVAVILEELCAHEYDVVYCFNLDGLGTLAICDLLTDLRVPWVWHLMDCVPRLMFHDLLPDIGALFSTYANRRVGASRVIAMSQRLLDEIREVGISLGDAASIIPGWALEPLAPVVPRRNERLSFVSVGVVCEHKGADLILEALCLLDPAVLEKISVDFFGRGDLANYRSKAGRLGVAQQVTFHGQVDQHEVLAALPNYDGLLFPTWEREPFGFVTLEAAANGVTPVITSGIGASEVLVNNVHALHTERSPVELCVVITDAVRNPDRFRAIGQEARSLVMSNFLLPFVARRVENELLGVAEPIRIGRDLAQKFIDINRSKYRIAQKHVVVPIERLPHEMPAVVTLTDSYRRFKYVGRDESNGIVMKLVRSGLMKILRPYFMDVLHQQQQLGFGLRSLNDRIDLVDTRIEQHRTCGDAEQESR